MWNFIKNILGKTKSVSLSASLHKEKSEVKITATIQSPASTLTQHTLASASALTELDQIWANNNNKSDCFPQGRSLWHCGTIGPDRPVDNSKALWTTKNSRKKNHYKKIAQADAARSKLRANLLEFSTKKELHLANFNKTSLLQFTIDYCGYDHNQMKATLLQWIISKQIDGIVSINGDQDEVVIAQPATVLEQIKIAAI